MGPADSGNTAFDVNVFVSSVFGSSVFGSVYLVQGGQVQVLLANGMNLANNLVVPGGTKSMTLLLELLMSDPITPLTVKSFSMVAASPTTRPMAWAVPENVDDVFPTPFDP